MRQIKRDKDELRKLGYINKAFADKVPCDKIMEISITLQKMLKHANEADNDGSDSDPATPEQRCEADLVGMFDSIDDGAQVDLQALDD